MRRNMEKTFLKERQHGDCPSAVQVAHRTRCLPVQGTKYRHTCFCTNARTHTDITRTYTRVHPRTRTPHCNTPTTDVTPLRHLPSVLKVKVIKFKQVRVHNESNNDSLKVAKCFVILTAPEWTREISTVPIYHLAKLQSKERAWDNQR